MHKTNHTLPESAELLRIVLPLMTKYRIPVTPPNYAVWYEYASGINQQLNEKLDRFIKAGQTVNEATTTALYNEFIDLNNEVGQLEKAQQIFSNLQENVSSVLENACGKTSEYGETLNGYQSRIHPDLNLEQLNRLIGDLNKTTDQMVVNNKHLLKDLQAARNEVSTLKKQLGDVKRQVKTDSLTALANKRAFYEQVEEMEINGDFINGKHSLFMVDIDYFKKVNDTFGHLFGDKVIKAVALVLKKHTKGKDLPARFGGEEFIVLLPDTGIEGARVVAENIRKTIEMASIINPNNKQVVSKVTVSIGVTEFFENDDIESVIQRADKALYAGKNNGRNQVVEAGLDTLIVLGQDATQTSTRLNLAM